MFNVGAHVQCVNNHNAKFEYKGMKTAGITDHTNQTPLSSSDGEKSPKNKKIFVKCAQNRRCTCSMYEQSLCKV